MEFDTNKMQLVDRVELLTCRQLLNTPSTEAATESVKKDVLRNFAKFTGKRLCQSIFFNKVAGLRPVFL